MKKLLQLMLLIAVCQAAPFAARADLPLHHYRSSGRGTLQFTEMLSRNTAGFKKFAAAHTQGLHVYEIKVSMPDDLDTIVIQGVRKTIKYKYVVDSSDCAQFVIQQCKSGYRWVVTESVVTDGITAESTFNNEIYPLQQ